MSHPPNTPLGRFGVETLVDSPDPFVGAMPLAGLVNPVTGAPTVAPLAMLVDFVAGLAVVRSNAAFLPLLIGQGHGHIVNTASLAGLFSYSYDRLPTRPPRRRWCRCPRGCASTCTR